MNGKLVYEDWGIPEDYDNSRTASERRWAELQKEPIGKSISGNLGQTLIPNAMIESGKSSTNEHVQIVINANGNLNHRTVGIAHEFGHVVLYLRGTYYSHNQPGVNSFINMRATEVSKRLGYDF